jgi:ribosomal protein S18 acetylase RimI-like enzyme
MYLECVKAAEDELAEAFQRLIPQLTTNHPPPSLAELQALVAFPGSVLVIARESESGPIVGSATLSILRTPTGAHARLEDVVVDSSARSKGVGEALTKEVLRLAGESGADYIALTSNPKRAAANRLYQRMGFKKWETNVYKLDLLDDE